MAKISDNLKTQITDAMKARDSVRVSTLKMLSSELHNATIDNHNELSEEQELEVVKKEAKKRRDSIEAYEKAGREELAESEKQELKILEEYLPEQISDEELEKIVADSIDQTGASTMADMGKVMGLVKQKAGASADGSRIAELVKNKLSS